MANYYVRSGAGGAGTGADWANAYTTLATAMSGKAAGDVFWVADDHAENSGTSAMTLASPGSAAAPCRILCVNTHATEPPTGLAATATFTTTTGGSATIRLTGFAYIYGCQFIMGSGSSSSIIMGVDSGSPFWIKFEKCLLRVATTGATAGIALGTSASAVDDSMVEFVDTQLQFGATGQTCAIRCKFRWTSPGNVQVLASTAQIPTTLFTPNNDAVGWAEIMGVDFSQLTSGKSLISLATTSSMDFTFIDCRLSTDANRTTGSSSGIGGSRVKFINCNSGDVNYDLDDNQYEGRITHEISVVRTTPPGASDGTTTVSRLMTTGANARFEAPLYSDWSAFWNETTGSAVGVAFAVLTNNVTLTDAEAWIEVEYLGTSGFPLGKITTDRATNIMTTGTNQATDSASTWANAPGTPVKQTLGVSITPQEKGLIRARVCLARASTAIYFDPKPDIT